MNRFKKINDSWCVEIDLSGNEIENGVDALVGTTVSVGLASGAIKQVQLGAYVGNGCFATAPRAAAPKVEIGSLDGILQLFNLAANRLKFPAVVLNVPGLPDGVRVSRAGQRAKQPGTLNVTAGAKDDSEYGRTWYGRVGLDGSYSPSRDAIPAIADVLKAFAANPAKVAAEYGRLTGICCFCRKALTDERSTAVGYGKICAGHYGLPWGATAVEEVVECDEADFHQLNDDGGDRVTDCIDPACKVCEQEDYQNHAQRPVVTGFWSPRG